MNRDDHQRWSEDLAAYMLGALEPEEAAELERHAEGCERCLAEMRWLTPAVEALPETVERMEPPSELRSRLMAEVQADAGEAAPAGPRRRGLGAWLRGSDSTPLALRPAVALTALALLVLGGVAGYALGGGSEGSSGGGSVKTTLVVAGHAPGITARLIRVGDIGTLRLTHVRQLSGGHVLEAWIERNGAVTPVRALFVPDKTGHASTLVGNVHGAEAVLVTAEPRGGSLQPTTEPIVAVPLKG